MKYKPPCLESNLIINTNMETEDNDSTLLYGRLYRRYAFGSAAIGKQRGLYTHDSVFSSHARQFLEL